MARITRSSIEPLLQSINAQGILLDDKSERLFTDLVQSSLNGTRPHKVDRTYTVAPWTHFRSMRPSLSKLNEALGDPFEVLAADPGTRVATGFKFKADIVANLGDLVGETPIRVDTGRQVRKERHAVARKDTSGNRSTFNLPVYQSIPVDVAALQRLAKSTDKIEAANASTIIRQAPNGKFLQQYQENQSGRLFGKGINLMNIRANVRREAMPSGAIEFDVANCHAVLLNYLAQHLGCKTRVLSVYAADPMGIRREIGVELGVPYDVAKRIPLMSIYWAGITAGIQQQVIDAGGNPEALKEGLTKNLWKDIRRAGRYVIKHAPRRNGRHSNALGKEMEPTEKPGTVLSHYLIGLERLVTDTAMTQASDVLLLEHDGFSALGGDTEMFAEVVLKETGIPVDFTIKNVKI